MRLPCLVRTYSLPVLVTVLCLGGAGLLGWGLIRSVALVTGESMLPTLPPGSLVYRTPGQPGRQDMVIATAAYPWNPPSGPGQDRTQIIKRVAGVPGDTITLAATGITVRTQEGATSMLPVVCQHTPAPTDPITFTLPSDQYLLLGDNVYASKDARWWYCAGGTYGFTTRRDDLVRVAPANPNT